MPFNPKRKIFMAGGSLRVNIPREVANLLKVDAGDYLEFDTSNSEAIIRRAKKG